MRYRIVSKLKEVGATSREKAVTIEKAGFNLQERNWLNYVAGGFSKVKKTKNKRYYIQSARMLEKRG